MMSDYEVNLVDDSPSDMYVIFHGPKDSAPRPPCPGPSWVGGRSCGAELVNYE